jgi:hypothetical protein
VALNFFGANVTVNNLGGKGPNYNQPEELRFTNIGVYNDEEFDLVVTVAEGSNYIATTPETNGQNGRFGQINLEVGGNIHLNACLCD